MLISCPYTVDEARSALALQSYISVLLSLKDLVFRILFLKKKEYVMLILYWFIYLYI